MVKKKILDTIVANNLIDQNQHIVIGLSGGPDSVCLFDVLDDLSLEYSWHLHVVHVNHKFRPGAAEEDEEYVKTLCKNRNVDCRVFTYDCRSMAEREGISSEEAGRQARYEAFATRAKELTDSGIATSDVKIAVAHNYNDQAETLLLRILRGTGVDGLAGMDLVRKGDDGIDVIRPLLNVSRKEIEEYCGREKLEPRTDETNLQPLYTRNKIRLELIPFIEDKFDANITAALNRLAVIAREDKEYFAEITKKELVAATKKRTEDQVVLDLKRTAGLAKPIRHRLVVKAFEKIGLEQDITAAHLAAADRLIKRGITPQCTSFPRQYSMKISYNDIIISREDKGTEHSQRFTAKKSIVDRERAYEMMENGEWIAIFDWDQICTSFLHHEPSLDDIVLRTRSEGDYLSLGEGKGSKKLKSFFVDSKIPKEQRDEIPVLAAGKEILWIILPQNDEGGRMKHRYSGKYKVKSSTKRVLAVELLRET